MSNCNMILITTFLIKFSKIREKSIQIQIFLSNVNKRSSNSTTWFETEGFASNFNDQNMKIMIRSSSSIAMYLMATINIFFVVQFFCRWLYIGRLWNFVKNSKIKMTSKVNLNIYFIMIRHRLFVLSIFDAKTQKKIVNNQIGIIIWRKFTLL